MGPFGKSHSDRLQEEHDRGESDAAKGVNNPRNFEIEAAFSATMREENDAYKAGQDNHDNQERENNSSCFITTACVEFHGLPDNCQELETLRRFRDTYMATGDKHRGMIAEYYKNAPSIVSRMLKSGDAPLLFADVFKEIKCITGLIESGQSEDAVTAYRAMYYRLSTRFNR